MRTIGAAVGAFFKARLALQVENIALRHPLIILRRSSPKRLRLTRLDRMIIASRHRLKASSAQLSQSPVSDCADRFHEIEHKPNCKRP